MFQFFGLVDEGRGNSILDQGKDLFWIEFPIKVIPFYRCPIFLYQSSQPILVLSFYFSLAFLRWYLSYNMMPMRRRWIDTSKDYIWICALVSLHHIYSGSDLFAIPALLSSAAFDWPVSVWVGGAVRGKKFALFYPIKTFSNVKSIRGKQKYFSIPIEWILKQPENEISPISHTFRTGAAVSGHPVSTHTPTMANEQEQQQWQSGTFHCRWPLLLIIMVGAL